MAVWCICTIPMPACQGTLAVLHPDPMRALVVLIVFSLSAAGCVLIFQKPVVEPASLADLGARRVTSPLRVHLEDGSVAVFRDGATFSADSISGDGIRVTFFDNQTQAIRSVALDRVLGAEVYTTETDVATSVLASAGASAVGYAALGVAAFALFGSCPTVYAVTPDSLALEAELFSNSIAPLFEMRDRDVLRHARPDADGLVRLEIRNEALETHYIDHLALEAVEHSVSERALPADGGGAIVLRDEVRPLSATDRTGRDVLAALAHADGQAYATPDAVTAAVTEADLTDAVVLAFPRPAADSVALALRFRSSLLTTVLLYEHMLAGQGARGLDWIGQDMASIGAVAEFGDYYLRRLGLRVDVLDRGQWREVDRIAEAGPIAWAERAVVVPIPDGETLTVRLRFVADGWRLDAATLGRARRAPAQPVALASVTDDDGRAVPELADQLGTTDLRHAVRGPGSVFHVAFAAPPAPLGRAQTLFVSAQGHYIEWMRPDWLRQPDRGRFQPTDSTLVAAIGTWRAKRGYYESRFESSMLPVR